MRTKAPELAPIFRSRLQADLLTLMLLGSENKEWAPTELQKQLGASAASVHRELQRLVRAGLIEKAVEGRNSLYRVSGESDVIPPLRLIVERTVGLEQRLKESFEDVSGLEHVSIFGSWARDEVSPNSDVDLLVVGDRGVEKAFDIASEVEAVVGREINLCAYSPDEFRRKRNNGFLKEILKQSRKHIAGKQL